MYLIQSLKNEFCFDLPLFSKYPATSINSYFNKMTLILFQLEENSSGLEEDYRTSSAMSRREQRRLHDWKSKSVDCWLRDHFTSSNSKISTNNGTSSPGNKQKVAESIDM